MKLEPLAKTSLLDDTVHTLQRSIIAGGYEPGSVLSGEGKMAQELGVSRTVVREAMRVLEARGLVEIAQGKAPRYRGGNPEAVSASLEVLLMRKDHGLMDLLEVRRHLETEIAALAAERATPEQIEAMQQAIDDLRLAKDDLDAMVEADIRFHNLLAEATGNLVFRIILEPLMGVLQAARRQTLTVSGAAHPADRHQIILEAIKRRSPDETRENMARHLELTAQFVARHYRPAD
ncbi:MAG: FadR family transcriptional regulator [Phycisphaerae bacterium]|nr:FadR family transcriptional regulator [Phycisphaerae bacterium]